MRRLSFLVSILVLVLTSMLLASSAQVGTAQEGTPSTFPAHPVVGTWVFDTDAADPANVLSYAAFHADGTYGEVHPLVGVGVGAWRPTGARTADLTIVFQDVDPSPAGVAPGTLVIRAAVEVDPTGDALTAPFTSEGWGPDGTVLFTNAFTATATRLVVEPMGPLGTPVAGTPTP
jgi:hypothetical protein